MKPWDPPEERLYPVLDDLLDDWRGRRAPGARRAARRRPPLVGGVARDPRLPGPQPRPVPVARRRSRRGGAAAARRRRARRRPAAGARSSRTATALVAADASASWPSGSACARTPSCPFYDLVDRRRRAGRAGRGGVRRLRGPAHRARRARGARRTGRAELADRELPRLPGRPSAAPTSRGARRRRRAASAPRCSPPARSPRCEASGPSRVVRLDDGAELGCHSVLIATGVTYRRLDAPGSTR